MKNLEFEYIKGLIEDGQQKALQSVNYYLLSVYWRTGGFISAQLQSKNWGEKVVDSLALWLKKENPSLKGFDRRSLYRMKEFYEAWTDVEMIDLVALTLPPQIVGTLSPQFRKDAEEEQQPKGWVIVGTLSPQLEIMPTFLTKIPWSQHLDLLAKTKTREEKIFYLALSIKEKYTVRELRRQIESAYFERQIMSRQKIKTGHPKADIINNVFKDSYIAEFINLPESYSENDLQKQLVMKMKDFVLELGRDFIFIGYEYKVMVACTITTLICFFITGNYNVLWLLT